ncbi:MAG: leucine--tRNA ligase [Phycisphaerae bacterium]
MAYNFTAVQKKWQAAWEQQKPFRALDPAEAGDRPKAYLLDMFPYPSGAGLHVGHPEGWTATDILARFLRMSGYNVMHPMGWDAFGLPAEQHAIETGTHPRDTTRRNVDNFRRQIKMLGLGYDWDREVNTTDPGYFKWTQWMFLQMFESYFDPIQNRAMPIGHLVAELQNENYVITPDYGIVTNPTQEGMEAIGGQRGIGRLWHELTVEEQRIVVDNQRLAYTDEVAVNWCPNLGTVLANEEVIDGKSERGNHPVERRPMRQWLLRITKYADRLLEDLEPLDWPESVKTLQRNWIGRSEGAEVDFNIEQESVAQLSVFTTRPDTLYGATYMVLAPEHPLVEQITTDEQRSAVEAYREQAGRRSERDRIAETKQKTGVFTGAYAINPVNEEKLPVWVADYVLMGYGTGAIMAVPAHDERDFEFAKKFELPIRRVVEPAGGNAAAGEDAAFVGTGVAVNSPLLDGLSTPEAKARMIDFLRNEGVGRGRTTYKLRDWLFSRQRYWGEPFPILIDADGNYHAVPEGSLPVTLPDMTDFKPTGTPEGPLTKAADWLKVETDRGTMTRETNTMPQWAGSCWYYLRYLDPHNDARFCAEELEQYWLPVDLYVGGVEHAVLHLLYSRFWHKVLHDLGHVSHPEPFNRLINQGMILGETEYAFFELPAGAAGAAGPGSPARAVSLDDMTDVEEEATDAGPRLMGTVKATGERIAATPVIEPLVEKRQHAFVLKADPNVKVDARSFKMSKSRGNVVNPDEIVENYGADCFRLYEMYMGPLEAQKPWSTRDIVGMARFLNAVHRHIVGDEENNVTVQVTSSPIPDELERLMHRTIKKVGQDVQALRFNVAIAELIKLNNEMGKLETMPRKLAEVFALLLAPFAPHLAEELWSHLGHNTLIATAHWPRYDEGMLVESEIELPVQVNGKLRARIRVPADADEQAVLATALHAENVRPYVEGKQLKKQLYVPGRLVNLVVG